MPTKNTPKKPHQGDYEPPEVIDWRPGDHRVVTDLPAQETAYIVYATTDNEMQAAAIARRLIEEEGRDATTADVANLPDVRSSFKYAVLAERICDLA